ncbi:hypothetical protein QPK31_00880 [Massilia sp. YIM B02769]|uniref:hypothetical protein n=1 Tax=Massilia sp. YIM B02769 TaxID=3050129 RepID=UPI0025B6D317|nr:hypothetical protein [Massilia sp. YIM B02769]MDN4056766.1 hypothetical protein [Massilia sp. YIM B02769]
MERPEEDVRARGRAAASLWREVIAAAASQAMKARRSIFRLDMRSASSMKNGPRRGSAGFLRLRAVGCCDDQKNL